MAVTRLKRKGLRNSSRATNKKKIIKRLNSKPPIKKVDIEELKKNFPGNETAKAEAAPQAEATAPAEEEKEA
ncbi:MAG: hypothetical protein WBA12_12185 [Catalinimonas sp.]